MKNTTPRVIGHSTDFNRVDIRQGKYTLSAWIGNQPILSKHKGRDWTVEPGAELSDVITAAITLLDFIESREVAA